MKTTASKKGGITSFFEGIFELFPPHNHFLQCKRGIEGDEQHWDHESKEQNSGDGAECYKL